MVLEARPLNQYHIGAALAMAPNAMWVFRQLGIAERITQSGSRIDRYQFVTPQGRVLKSINLDQVGKGWGESAWAVPRTHILRSLLEALPPGVLVTDSPVTAIYPGQEIGLDLANNESHKTLMLIGADGAHSIVRDTVWPKLPEAQFQNFVAMRGVIEYPLPPAWSHSTLQVWGGRGEFGFSPMGESQVYWFATLPWTDAQNLPTRDHFLRHFRQWFAPVNDLLRLTADDDLLIHPIFDQLRPFTEVPWPMTLIGDAAHLMTPNTGQGACQGIMDAWVLAQEVANTTEPLQAIERYRNLRLNSALFVARQSHRMGKIIHQRMPLAVKTGMLRITPEALIGYSMRRVVGNVRSVQPQIAVR